MRVASTIGADQLLPEWQAPPTSQGGSAVRHN
jgi:hypothetical protein